LVHYAFHDLYYIQLTDQWQLLGNGTYIPTAQDLQAQSIIQSNMWNFFLHREPTAAWAAVNSSSQWPNSYSLFDLSVDGTASQVDYRQNICNYYQEIALIAPTYWWSN
jgi:hypothetical protein